MAAPPLLSGCEDCKRILSAALGHWQVLSYLYVYAVLYYVVRVWELL